LTDGGTDGGFTLKIDYVLERLKNSPTMDLIKDESLLLTRDQWADHLGVSRVTVFTWEKDIVTDIPFLEADYYQRQKRGRYLDNYQRFILALILFAKSSEHPLSRSSNKSVKTFIRLNFNVLKRKIFDEVIKHV
jgi:hypothetical protein